jgi:hypothetical protein
MVWLNQRFELYTKSLHSQDAVKRVAAEIYDGLWKEVVEVIAAADKRGMGLKFNGSPLNHTVTMGRRNIAIKLDDDKCGITVTLSDGPGLTLKLRECASPAGATVCIEHEGATIDYPNAARMIMEPFLFGGESPYAFLFPDA